MADDIDLDLADLGVPARSSALLDAALDWLRGQGMTRTMGPFNFNTNHECGVLVDPFDSDPLVLMIWNKPYYPAMYDRLGLGKAKDMLAYWMDNNGPCPPRIAALADRFMERHPEVKRARLVVDNAAGGDRMMLHVEVCGVEPQLADAIVASIRDVTKLRGEVTFRAVDELPNDGKVIADERPVG